MFNFNRSQPLKDFKPESGSFQNFEYGANTITGWRVSQEDRVVCFPDYTETISFFAIYDGHGGEEVAEYLKRNLHECFIDQLAEYGEIQKALVECFLTSDQKLRDLNEEEFSEIKSSTLKEFNFDEVMSSTSSDKAATSVKEDFMAEVKSQIFKEILKMQTNLSSASHAKGKDSASDAKETDSSSDAKEKESSSDVKGKNSTSDVKEKDSASDVEEEDNPEIKEDNKRKFIPSSLEGKIALAKLLEKKKDESVNKSEDTPLVGLCCGSTATVVIVYMDKIFIANVGDSRCVASVNGKAVVLSVDHRPTISKESERIRRAGNKVTADGRIDGGLNMSRAFGDYALKKGKVNSSISSNAVIPDPYVNVIDVTPDLEFVILASDGIWNAYDNQFVVNFVSENMEDMDLPDICSKLFEKILSKRNGKTRDNMSMIIIKQKSSENKRFKKLKR